MTATFQHHLGTKSSLEMGVLLHRLNWMRGKVLPE